MDWMFYLVVLVVLFSIIAVLGIFRYLMHVRLKRIEKKLKMEEEARQIAESNSGL
jgi:uncharacterized membrane protein YcjF (UPF0283 family)